MDQSFLSYYNRRGVSLDSIIEQIYENSVRLPGKTALTGQGQSVTYQELWNRAEAFAGELKKTARIRKGSRILLEEGEDLIKRLLIYSLY